MACFWKKGSFFSSKRSFSGITFIFSKAPAFSNSSIVVSPYTVTLEAPKFTIASETPSRCFTFFSNFVAQPAQENPWTRYTAFLLVCSTASPMSFYLLLMHNCNHYKLFYMIIIKRVKN